MEKHIHLEKVQVECKGVTLFKNFTFDFLEGTDVCLIGLEGCGKSTLLSCIQGSTSFKGEILKEASCQVVLSRLCVDETIFNHLAYTTLSSEEKKLVDDFLKLSSYQYVISKLNETFQVRLAILDALLCHPKFLFIDDVLSSFTQREKQELFTFIKHLGITLFYVTSNMEDVLFFEYLIVMGSEGILMEGATQGVLLQERILKRLGFSLPFFVDLSLQLQSYDLLDHVILNGKELMNDLWKLD